jgi:AhpD family alkylhydroperoxidase
MNLRAYALALIGQQQPSLIRYVHPRESPSDEPVRRQIVEEFGFLPAPLLLHASVKELLPASWMILRETTLTGIVPRAVKEALSLMISRANRCPFCEETHAMTLLGLRRPELVDAMAPDEWNRLGDPQIARILGWVTENSKAREPDAIRSEAPFSPEEAAEIIGTIVLFHYLNRVVNVFLAESPLPGPRRMPGWNRAGRWLGGRVFERLFRRSLLPGESLQFLPEAVLAHDLGWARAHPAVAGAFARFDHVLTTAAVSALPVETRKLVEHRLASWRGELPGLDKQSIDEALLALPAEEKPLARLALLVAFVPYRVLFRDIEDARTRGSSDADLVGTVAWAAFAAARRIGSYLG